VSVGGRDLTTDEIAATVAKTLSSRIKSTATQHDHLLDEENSLSTVVQFEYKWRKQLSAAEKAAAKKAASDAGRVYAEDDIPESPLDVQFDASFWNRAFGDKADFTEGRYALAGYVESIFSTSPVPHNWTLEGIQGKPVERVHTANGQKAMLTIMPGMTSTAEMPLFRLKDVNTKHLFKHGNLDMSAEIEALMPVKGTPLMLVDPARKLGKILKKNEARVIKNEDGSPGQLTVVPILNMYAVHEETLADVLAALNDQVLTALKPTNFPNIVGRLSRADRSPSQAAALDFADYTDAAGLTKAGRQHAESTTHSVVINVRLHAIDPSKLEEYKQ